jgi:hypothetical protein
MMTLYPILNNKTYDQKYCNTIVADRITVFLILQIVMLI